MISKTEPASPSKTIDKINLSFPLHSIQDEEEDIEINKLLQKVTIPHSVLNLTNNDDELIKDLKHRCDY